MFARLPGYKESVQRPATAETGGRRADSLAPFARSPALRMCSRACQGATSWNVKNKAIASAKNRIRAMVEIMDPIFFLIFVLPAVGVLALIALTILIFRFSKPQ